MSDGCANATRLRILFLHFGVGSKAPFSRTLNSSGLQQRQEESQGGSRKMMQVTLDTTIIPSVVAAIVSIVLSMYLFFLWYRQENRLYSDLPLAFSIVFTAHALNQMLLSLTMIGVIPTGLDFFRIRALVVGGIALPMMVVLLNIWLHRFQKHHLRIMGLMTVYWVAIALFGPTQDIIMMLHLPMIITFIGGMVLTFIITWRTGRLKEVRSDLMVISTLLSLVGQVSLVSLSTAGLGFVSGVITVMATLLSTIALSNPWYRREQAAVPEASVATEHHL